MIFAVKTWVATLLHRIRQDEWGQGMVEYGLIIALVAIGVIAVLGFMRDELVETFNRIVTELNNAQQTTQP